MGSVCTKVKVQKGLCRWCNSLYVKLPDYHKDLCEKCTVIYHYQK